MERKVSEFILLATSQEVHLGLAVPLSGDHFSQGSFSMTLSLGGDSSLLVTLGDCMIP